MRKAGFIERIELFEAGSRPNDEVQKTIREFNKHDPSGQIFRYSLDTSGKRGLPRQIYVDLTDLQKRMKDVHDYLFGIDDWLYEGRMQKCEY